MKFITTILLVAFTAATTLATSTYDVSSVGQSLMIKTDAKVKSTFEITLQDAQGQIFYKQYYTAQTNSPTIKLNVAQLHEGSYEVIFSDDFKVQTQSFDLTGKLINLTEDKKTMYKPFVKIKDHTVLVNFLNQDNVSTLTITDALNNVLYQEQIAVPQYGKQFNLRDAPAGEYTVQILQNNAQYFSKIIIK